MCKYDENHCTYWFFDKFVNCETLTEQQPKTNSRLRSLATWHHPSCGWLLFSTLRSRAQWAMRSFIHGVSNGLNVLAMIHRRRYTTIDSRWGWQKRSRPLENTGCEFTNTAICGRLSLLFQAREEDTYCPDVMILKALLWVEGEENTRWNVTRDRFSIVYTG